MARREYSEETRAAVMASLLAGQSVSSVSKDYNIPRSTVANWSAIANKAGVPVVPSQKNERIGELLLDYLEENLKALRVHSKVFSDEAWLKKQHASDAAVFHGVMTDKAVRLLEAFGDDSDSDTAS